MYNYSKLYPQTQEQKPNTWLYFKFYDDITHELDQTLPYPHRNNYDGNTYVYGWLIDGFFKTRKNIEYLNDIIARMKITFPDSQYIKKIEDNSSNINPMKLKQFQNLKSRAIEKINQRAKYDGTKDFVFWCLKLHAEDIIREQGIFTFQELCTYAIDSFIDEAKDQSTLRAKSRAIFNWYCERDFPITQYTKKTKGEVMATRVEHAKKLAKNKSDEAKRKVLNCITGLYAHEYKKANGKFNISKIANDTNLTRPTVMKYLPKDTLF